eukprot:SAG31_NODE_125_length_23649_cov_7.156202_9_plen_261_part_00
MLQRLGARANGAVSLLLRSALKATCYGRVYSPSIWQLEFDFGGRKVGSTDPWHVDLMRALSEVAKQIGEHPCAGETMLTAVIELQSAYEAGRAFRLLSSAELAKAGIDVSEGTATHGRNTVVWMGGPAAARAAGHGRPFAAKLVAYAGTMEKGRANLALEVEHALQLISRPQQVYGRESGVDQMLISNLLLQDNGSECASLETEIVRTRSSRLVAEAATAGAIWQTAKDAAATNAVRNEIAQHFNASQKKKQKKKQNTNT